MTPVKPRTYHSPLRRQQATATRQLILEAARARFLREGYLLTSVPAIAADASVSPKTVHLAFGTKARLLRAVWEARLAADEVDVPLLERRWFRDLTSESTPGGKLRRLAHQSRTVKERSGDLTEVIRNAASADEQIAEIWADIESELLRVQQEVVGQLVALHALRLDPAAAIDILWTLNHPNLWHLLVRSRGWTADQYERWLRELTCSQLLTDYPDSPSR